MPDLMQRLRPHGAPPPSPALKDVCLTGLGVAAAIAALGGLSLWAHSPALIAPFGASAVIAFLIPESPFSQPRSIIGGHLTASLIGLAVAHLLPAGPVAVGVAVGLAAIAMALTRTVHPPAGADPIVIALTSPGWSFLLAPVLLGAVLLTVAAVVFHRLRGHRAYPRYWI